MTCRLRACAALRALRVCAGPLVLLAASDARAADALTIVDVAVDRPTVTALGVQLLVADDDDHDATVSVRWRVAGDSVWHEGLPLWRVRPEVVTGISVPEQFAGSLFDLAPATTYELELHAVDPDGPVDETRTVTATTRAVPADPKTPHAVAVADAAALQAALDGAAPGDVITLANGTYAGSFSMDASGTAEQPIVIRGASRDGVVLDGQDCSCNVLEVYGSFVHVESLTIQNASRALRFQGQGAEGDVVRRVHIRDVTTGIGSKADQRDFYLCDNDLEGRLVWPQIYTDDGGAHANDDGIHVEGDGHVVCHNRLVGFGDALKTEQDGARAVDFYGNEVLSAYDNGLELDGAGGNVRALRNRFTNTYATMSFQPIFGGPAYALRNVVVNVAHEQLKFHALGTVPPREPSGMLVLHNTFVGPKKGLILSDDATSHHFVVENNLFIGPASPEDGRTVDWTGTIDDGTFDYDGYYPDGMFAIDVNGTYTKFASFAELQAAGIEAHGIVLSAPPFASLVPSTSYDQTLDPQDATLADGSPPIDRGLVLTGVNDGFTGAGPDLGALEVGCPVPLYGPRPEGVDETNEPLGCGSPGVGGGGAGGAGVGGDGAGASSGTGGSGAANGGSASGADAGDDGGCGCRVGAPVAAAPWGLALVAAALAVARRRRGATSGSPAGR